MIRLSDWTYFVRTAKRLRCEFHELPGHLLDPDLSWTMHSIKYAHTKEKSQVFLKPTDWYSDAVVLQPKQFKIIECK